MAETSFETMLKVLEKHKADLGYEVKIKTKEDVAEEVDNMTVYEKKVAGVLLADHELQIIFNEFGTMFIEVREMQNLISLIGRYVSRSGKTLTSQVMIMQNKGFESKLIEYLLDLRVGGDAL